MRRVKLYEQFFDNDDDPWGEEIHLDMNFMNWFNYKYRHQNITPLDLKGIECEYSNLKSLF